MSMAEWTKEVLEVCKEATAAGQGLWPGTLTWRLQRKGHDRSERAVLNALACLAREGVIERRERVVEKGPMPRSSKVKVKVYYAMKGLMSDNGATKVDAIFTALGQQRSSPHRGEREAAKAFWESFEGGATFGEALAIRNSLMPKDDALWLSNVES